MDDSQLLRYGRHVMLAQVGVAGQEALLAARALIIGAGGLGSPSALYLASAGVGHITLVDDDHVELSNLQRQIAHTTAALGQRKVDSAAERMHALNPEVHITTLPQRADAALLAQQVPQAQVVLDCSDNFATRHLINAACVQAGVHLVWAAAVQMDGQLAAYDPSDPTSACYACLFPPGDNTPDLACATMGVLSPLLGVMGSLQAMEALRLIVGQRAESPSAGLGQQLLMFDGRHMRFDTLRTQRQPDCPVCAARTPSAP